MTGDPCDLNDVTRRDSFKGIADCNPRSGSHTWRKRVTLIHAVSSRAKAFDWTMVIKLVRKRFQEAPIALLTCSRVLILRRARKPSSV